MFLVFAVLGGWFLVSYHNAEEGWNDLQTRLDTIEKPTSQILSADGVVLFKVSAENRIPLKLSEIPKMVRNAVLAAEDKRFYKHSGIDLTSMIRVIFVGAQKGKLTQGGSTISMQLVKMLINGSSRTFKRKMNDIAYAQVMEQNLSKDRILEVYLNKVYFGEGAFGIGEAAKVYFGKTVDKLTIGEAAMLARCIRLPSTQNPIRDPRTALDNRDVVLGIMREESMITEDEYDKALEEKPHVNPKPLVQGVEIAKGAEYFVYHVLQYIKDDLGIDLITGGYTIETTLDYKLQLFALQSVRKVVDAHRDMKVNQGAFMLMDSDGKILAEVGGLNWQKHQSNLITQGGLQPGSGFKTILYATALKEKAISLDTMLSNAPVGDPIGNTGKIHWYENSSRNETKAEYGVRTAFALSVNRPAIHLIKQITPEAVVEMAHDVFGFRSKLEPYNPLALGASAVAPIEMAEAYSVIMLRGDRVRPQPVVRVIDSEGKVAKEYPPDRFVGVLDPEVCDQMDELMKGVVQFGTGIIARDVPDARGKTGTTNGAKDAWFTGYSDGLLGVSWVGNEQKVGGVWTPEPMSNSVFGGTVSAQFWRDIMLEALKKYGKKPAQPADTIAEKPAKKKPKPADTMVDAADIPPIDPDQLNGQKTDATTGGDTAGGTTSGTDAGDGGDEVPPPDKGNDKSNEKGKDKDKSQDPDAPPKKPDPPKKSPPKKSNDDSETDTVTVEVCASTGLLANPYCPETVTKTFPRGKEPKRKCHLHGPGE